MTFLDGILALICISMVFFTKTIESNNTYFERRTTNSLRGIAMLAIVLHHIHNNLGFWSPVMSQVGYLATGLFFFISGYGNTLSIEKRECLKLSWLIDKIKKIYIPFIWAYVLYTIL